MRLKSCKRYIVGALLFVLIINSQVKAQEVGLSFSYFIPKDGYVSTPVSPFSIRGIGVDLNRYMALQTGFSLYRMAGLNIKDIEDFESKEPMLGPNFTIMVPLEFVLQFIGNVQEFRLKGGGFGFYGFANKLNYGNIDKAIVEANPDWVVANADFDFDHGIGLGFFFGAEYVVQVTNQWGLSLEANYFIGDADIGLNGSYTGGTMTDLETRDVDYKDSKVDYTGLEISIGILFGS